MENFKLSRVILLLHIVNWSEAAATWNLGGIRQLLTVGPGEYNANDAFFEGIKNGYNDEANKRNIYPKIANLPDYLDQLGNHRCLILLNMFQEINMNSCNYPIVLRTLEPAVLWLTRVTFHGSMRKYQLIWKHREKFNQTFKVSKSGTVRCPLSKYLVGGRNIRPWKAIPDLCVRINLNQFVSATKPWNCQGDVHIFPEEYTLFETVKWSFTPKVHFPRNFKSSAFRHEYYRFVIPSPVPPVHILVVTHKLWNSARFQEVRNITIRSWINGMILKSRQIDLSGFSVSHGIFLAAIVTSPVTNSNLHEPNGFITDIY